MTMPEQHDLTIRSLLNKAENSLVDFDNARLEAEVLLAHILDTERSKLYANFDMQVDHNSVIDYNSVISRRQSGFPLAYLVGKKEFWSTELIVTKDTLIPRPETELLVENSLALIPENSPYKILDLGTGTGAIAISIARERPESEIYATDINFETLNISRLNVERLQVSNITLLHSDWFSELENMKFDLIVSNPPYINSNNNVLFAGEVSFEPRVALDGGHQGIQAIKSIISAAYRHLNRGCALIIEHGYDQAELTQALFHNNKFTNIKTLKDLAGHDRITMGYTL